MASATDIVRTRLHSLLANIFKDVVVANQIQQITYIGVPLAVLGGGFP